MQILHFVSWEYSRKYHIFERELALVFSRLQPFWVAAVIFLLTGRHGNSSSVHRCPRNPQGTRTTIAEGWLDVCPMAQNHSRARSSFDIHSARFNPRDARAINFPGKKHDTRGPTTRRGMKVVPDERRERRSRNFCARHATPTPTPPPFSSARTTHFASHLSPRRTSPRASLSQNQSGNLLFFSFSFLGIEKSRIYRQFSLTGFPRMMFLCTRSDVTQTSVFTLDAFAEKIWMFKLFREIFSLPRECPSRETSSPRYYDSKSELLETHTLADSA